MALDEAQQAAVNHYNGPAMILAGPGSGKTTVITNRVMKLISSYGVPPDKILVITFTKKAALEMKSRYLKLTGQRETDVTFGTFHAVFFMILRNVKGYNAEDIVKTSEQREFVNMFLRAKGIVVRDQQAFVEDIISEIAKVKSGIEAEKSAGKETKDEAGKATEKATEKEAKDETGKAVEKEAKDETGKAVGKEAKDEAGKAAGKETKNEKETAAEKGAYIENFKSSSCENELFDELYEEYARQLKAEHKVDFEDMLADAYRLLSENEDILEAWQRRYEYVLIDEFQDSSKVQFSIVKMLCAVHRNIFVVGDDDQSIYGFRGAVPAVMKDFIEYYKDAAVYRLNTNYRSTDTIVKAATAVINGNKQRFFKDLRAFNKAGAVIEVIEFNNIEEEGKYIAKVIEETTPTIAVLTRTNAGAAGIVKRLIRRGVEVDYRERKRGVFGHWIAEDIKAFLRIALGENNRIDYIRIVNKPSRHISRVFFTEEIVDCGKVADNMRVVGQDKLVQDFCLLAEDLQYAAGLNTYGAFTYIRKKIGYEQYLKQYAANQCIDERKLFQVLDELQATTVDCGNIGQWLEMAERSIDNRENKMSMDRQMVKNSGDGVSFLTMHGAKGLEFDTVFIPDVNEGVVPYDKAVLKEAVEEERRIFYVAMTRAKKKLVICYTKERYNRYVQPSRFLRELCGCENVKFYNCDKII